MAPRKYTVAIVLFPDAQPLDFIGPLDVLQSISPGRPITEEAELSISTTLVAESLEAVTIRGGTKVIPQQTFAQAKEVEWDIVLVPGGQGARPWMESNAAARAFLEVVVPKVEYVLTVCTGSWLLAATGPGLLRGQRATTNKAAYNAAVENTADKGVEWVPKARWVTSNKFWTSSGVTAGIDMAAAFIRFLLVKQLGQPKAKEVGDKILGILEVTENEEGDDPWAEYYHLV